METPLRLWLDAYRAPLIPMPQEFSWQCDLGRWRSLEPCFALCVKIIIIFNMWLPLHAKVQYLHSRYQLLVNFMNFYCFRVFHREFLWPTDVNFNIIAWMPNVYALSNASHSNYLFLAQWRLVLLWKCCFMFHQLLFISYDCLLLSLLPWQWFSFTLMLYHKIHELFYLWCQTNWIYRKNCAINAQVAIHLKLQL